LTAFIKWKPIAFAKAQGRRTLTFAKFLALPNPLEKSEEIDKVSSSEKTKLFCSERELTLFVISRKKIM